MSTIHIDPLVQVVPDIIPVTARAKPGYVPHEPVCTPSCVLINQGQMPAGLYHLTLMINGESQLLRGEGNLPVSSCRIHLADMLYLAELYHVNGNGGNTYFNISSTSICGIDPFLYGDQGTVQPLQFGFVETPQPVAGSVDALNLIFAGPVSFHGCGFYYNLGY